MGLGLSEQIDERPRSEIAIRRLSAVAIAPVAKKKKEENVFENHSRLVSHGVRDPDPRQILTTYCLDPLMLLK